MIDLIVKLLSPLLTPMGVTTADLTSYVTRLSGYIYAILILLALTVVIVIAAHWLVKKGTRHVIRWSAVIAYALIVVLMVNLICYGPMYSNVSGFLNASPIELSDDVVANSQQVIRETGEEGMVLLKNTGLLPLEDGTSAINVFGWAQTYPIYGGTGSGGSSTADNISILQSLEDAGYETNSNLTKMYKAYTSRRPTNSIHEQDWTLPEPPLSKYTDAVLSQAEEFSDTALIVIGRVGGEGFDLPTDMNMVSSDYDGSYGYMISDACVRAGGDIMLGYGSAESNVFSDTSAATCVTAMRRASKNILYSIGNSGNYKDASSIDESGGMSNMTKLFLKIDIIAGAVLLALEAIVLIRYFIKRRKQKKMEVQHEN